MPRAGLNKLRVVEEAGKLADEVGLSRLTLVALAQRLGVRQPSIYKHVVGVVGDVMAGYHLEGDDAIDAIRVLRAALHGSVALEASGGFGLPVDIDRSFDRLVAGLEVALAGWSTLSAAAGSRR